MMLLIGVKVKINDHQFYLMFLLGDDETASILAQYDKKEVS